MKGNFFIIKERGKGKFYFKTTINIKDNSKEEL